MGKWAVGVHPKGAVVPMEAASILKHNAEHSLADDWPNVYAIVAVCGSFDSAQELARKMKRLRKQQREASV